MSKSKAGKSWSILQDEKNDKKKHHKINHMEETENVKWCVLKGLSILSIFSLLAILPCRGCLFTYSEEPRFIFLIYPT